MRGQDVWVRCRNVVRRINDLRRPGGVSRLLHRFGVETLYYFRSTPDFQAHADVIPIVRLSSEAVVDWLEQEVGLLARERDALFSREAAGVVPWGVLEDDRVLHVSWLREARTKELPPWVDARHVSGMIYDCRTAAEAQGRGLYRKTLRFLANRPEAHPHPILIYTHDWNHASQRGIVGAGFQKFAVLRRMPGCQDRWRREES